MLKSRLLVVNIILFFNLFLFIVDAKEGKIIQEIIKLPSLEGNLLGDSPSREVHIYLPPSYDKDPDRRYPVIFLLHGYTANHQAWTRGDSPDKNILLSMNSWMKEKKVEEMILVMPNSYNKLRGSFYTNSETTGNWADAIAKDLVKYIDDTYRTLKQPESRGLAGHSMGGFGAIVIGMLYPEVFSCIAGMAGVYNYERLFQGIQSYNSPMPKDMQEFKASGFFVQAMIAICAAFAPNPDRPPFYCDFPFTPGENKSNQTNDRFFQYQITSMAEKHLETLMSRREFFIDCGTEDWLCITDARGFHEKLNQLNVRHTYQEFAGDHNSHVMASIGKVLESFSKVLEFDHQND